MKALVLKEFRENVKLAALGLVIYTLLLVMQYRGYVASRADMPQPLTDSTLLWDTVWFCGLFGAVLGWLQIHNERRPDLWAFLLHRPMTRTQIFLGKALGGLGIYAVVVGAPLLVFIIWAQWPGHVPAPFEWAMLRPLAAFVLAGIVCYFAGMVTGLRQARWYASRALGLGMALIVCILIEIQPVWWRGFLLVLLGALVLIAAAWGSFQAHGYYRGQPAWGKAALTVALMLGALIVAPVVAGVVTSMFVPEQRYRSAPYYTMTKDGNVVKIIRSQGTAAEVVDMEGKPVMEPTTGRRIEVSDLSGHIAETISIDLVPTNPYRPKSWVQSDISRVVEWQASSDTLWHYWRRYGRLVGYDLATGRFIGSLGPQGFAKDLAGGGDRFRNLNVWRNERILWTATAVYRPDLEHRAVTPLFTTTSDDPILAAEAIALPGADWKYTAVTTKQFIYLLTAAGQPVWKVPYDSTGHNYVTANIYLLNGPGQFALWMSPYRWAKEQEGWAPPVHVMWITHDQGVVRSADLPQLPSSRAALRPDETVMSAVAPPVVLLALPWLNPGLWPQPLPREPLLICWAVAILVCLPIGLWLGRRYRLPLGAQVGWAVFHMLFGVPGLLAFLSVQEWPARVPCPNCQRPRLVDRPQCEHCGADFAPPEKTGTEVFAPLVAQEQVHASA